MKIYFPEDPIKQRLFKFAVFSYYETCGGCRGMYCDDCYIVTEVKPMIEEVAKLSIEDVIKDYKEGLKYRGEGK